MIATTRHQYLVGGQGPHGRHAASRRVVGTSFAVVESACVISGGATMSNGFDRSIVESTGHRPWPMPSAPWLMSRSWNTLLYAHRRVDAS